MYDVSVYTHLRRARDLVREAIFGRSARGRMLGSGPAYDLVRSPTMRRLAFVGDVASVTLRAWYHRWIRSEILIMDRYLYDLLVDAAGDGWPPLRWLTAITPRPDLPVLLAVDPERAFARKGEFDVGYLARRQEAYRQVFARIRDPLVVEDADLEATTELVLRAVLARLP